MQTPNIACVLRDQLRSDYLSCYGARHIGVEDDYAASLAEHGLQKYHAGEHDYYRPNKAAVLSRMSAENQVDT